MDKNQATGLVLIATMLVLYLYFFAPDPEELPSAPQTTEQIEGQSEQGTTQEKPSITAETEPVSLPDSVLNEKFGPFGLGMNDAPAETMVLENTDLRVEFSSKGGNIQRVILKNYVTYLKDTLILIDQGSSQMQEVLPTRYGPINLSNLNYKASKSGNTVTFSLGAEGSTVLSKSYTLPESGFQLYHNLDLAGVQNELNGRDLAFNWYHEMPRVELDMEQSRIRSTINYFLTDQTFDYLSESSEFEEESLDLPANWVSLKQKFFNASVIGEEPLERLNVEIKVPTGDSAVVKIAEMSAEIPLSSFGSNSNFRFYFGPNDYHICEEVAPEFQRNVYLGWAFFSTINLYLIMPLFEFLEGFITNYGIIILILVFIVKSALFPLTYRSYVSMAKMKVLKPELDQIKEKHGDDMQKVQQEQMKLYGQFGVNPLSGCIPILAQMPVFLALFNFFPNSIQLRQESFLWATDLSTYDSIMELPFTIPAYGAHISLFTLLMTISQIVYTYYNNEMGAAATQQGPMKSIGYVTPVIFMFFLNNFSSGLTYYYFVSNLITIIQQLAIRKIIDDGKIRAKLENNKKKGGGKKSKFQQRLEDAMKAQEEMKKKKK